MRFYGIHLRPISQELLMILVCKMSVKNTLLQLLLHLSGANELSAMMDHHDDVIKWKHFPRYWPFARGIHRCPVNSPHKGQQRGALMFTLICTWINGWVNNREAGDLRRHSAHYDVIVMLYRQPREIRAIGAQPLMSRWYPTNFFHTN